MQCVIYVDQVLDIMRENPDYHAAIYGLLFRLCGGEFCGQSDLNKLYGFYDEMKDKGIALQLPTANSLLAAGVSHFKFEMMENPENAEDIKKELLEFVDWALLQFKEYNLTMTQRQNDRFQNRLSHIMSINE